MKIAVFCGSSSGNDPRFVETTKALGKYFAEQGVDVVYGGGDVGLMGTIADAVLEGGGKVYGAIPEYLKSKEIAHPNLTELHVVKDMHERKAKMAELADAFVALPGGIGTLEEIFEVWTWAQLGHHSKPCAFYNVMGFYDPLFTMVEQMRDAGFVRPQYVDMLIKTDQAETLLEAIRHYQAPDRKWR
ncbi:LOG family protein YvdD [Marinomonas aquimarina]|uniref:Cytokinin riboside 5'-monophosphate phosphoribohydrolase n=1 Tax=Marinomonas aquimarina TaxID=295068 RepID=A0A1A8TCM5_9GAMM|nr:TIGR00730 family Rossman fold protein [Marinomonas aquimarina]SBS30507.1 LOG family protein YvdD [Marinomonas aquimarina]